MFHAQKMTPNTTAMMEAITMSIVRQRYCMVDLPVVDREETRACPSLRRD
jgi:hypothetical protein